MSMNIKRKLHMVKFKLKEKSPQILLGVGIAGVAVGTVLACKATLKLPEILENAEEVSKQINKVKDMKRDDYTEEDAARDMTINYAQTGLAIAKNYAPSALVMATSIGCILSGFNVLNKRHLALVSAYTVLDNSYKSYRKRVATVVGDDVENKIYHGMKMEDVEVVDKKGNVKIEKKEVYENGSAYSPYSQFFDNGNEYWEDDATHNLMFLRAQQDYANDLLRARGYLFLNEVYEALGMYKTKFGQVVGWIYDEKNDIGDNYVDFGMYNVNNENARDFINGLTSTILLDFNVDGNILDRLRD